MCCDNYNRMFIWLVVFAALIGLNFFDNFYNGFVQTLTDPFTWFIVAVVIIGSVIYKLSSRRRESHQH